MDYQDVWERKATVRSRPRKVLQIVENKGYYYPVSHQPICLHDHVLKLGELARKFILTQSLYKYSNDIAIVETSVVSKASLHVVKNILPVPFDFATRISMSSIIVDESYHAYVALDTMHQIEMTTGITPLPLPDDIELSRAMQAIKLKLKAKYHIVFELIAVCIAENILTKGIVDMLHEEETNQFLQNILKDHLADEGRHSGEFQMILAKLWNGLDEDYKQKIGLLLPEFLQLYLNNEIQKMFDRKILEALNMETKIIDQVIDDTHSAYKVTEYHPMMKNILKCFENTGVLNHMETKKSFEKMGMFC